MAKGLLHVSQMSATREKNPEDVVSVGELVWVKIIRHGEDGKYTLSIRFVNQTDGSDKDPNNGAR